MADLLEDLENLEKITTKKTISNYENAKGFISGSFEEHILMTLGSLTHGQRGYSAVNYSQILDQIKDYFLNNGDDKWLTNHSFQYLKRPDNLTLNKDNLITTTSFIFDELFNYAETNGINTESYKNEFNDKITNLSTAVDRLDNYFIKVQKLAFLCNQYYCTPRNTDDNNKSVELFGKIREFLVVNNDALFAVPYKDMLSYFIDSQMSNNFCDLFIVNKNLIADIRLNKKNNNVLTLADIYVLQQDDIKADTISKLQKTVFDKNIVTKLDFTVAQDLSSVILFSDHSLCYKEKNSAYKATLTHDEASGVAQKVIPSAVDFLLRKKPTLAKFFKAKLEEEFNKFGVTINTVRRFLENEALVKTYLKNDYEGFLKNLMDNKSMEAFDDAYTNMAEKQKFIQFAYSITSKKYKELYNDRSLEILQEIYNNKIDADQLQTYVGKKIAAFKTTEEFNKHLQLYLSKINGFDPDIIIENIEKEGATLVHYEDGILIAETTDYEQMSNLGSTSWCIVRDEYHYDNYATSNRQYIVYDFNKESHDIYSMIGITLFTDGTYRNAHLKNDDSVSSYDVEDMTDSILISQKETFPNMNKELKERLFPDSSKKHKLNVA